MKYFLTLLLTSLIFISCQKEIDWGNALNVGDFQPISAGSEWNYNSTTAGNYKLRSAGTDTMISGRKYNAFDRIATAGTIRTYINKTGGVYRQFGHFAPANQVIDMIFLKDSAVGTTWTETLSVSGFNNYHKYTVTGRNLQRTVNGTVYNDVIELDYKLSLDNPLGGVIQAGGGKNYYARKVGAIESFFTIGFMTFSQSDTTRLVSYTIQ